MQKVKYYRWAPSLGEFEESPEKVWGVKYYNPESQQPCVFCGLYGLKDFYTLWNYKGDKHVWWAGSDIRHFINGYWLDDTGIIKLDPRPLARWISQNCTSWVENEEEFNVLAKFGIISEVIPSFLGDVKKFTPQNIKKDKKRYYSSVSGDNFTLYGWDKINKLAEETPDTEYHLYGNTVPWKGPKNVVIHGRVSKEQMNEETKSMTGAIRMVEFEGFSEILAKSILWGQKPISLIKYPFKNRKQLLSVLNKYPWNTQS